MDTVLFLGFALAYLALLIWGLGLAARHGWWTPANLPLLVVAALVYDNAALGLGRFIGEGPLLEALNYARYYIHAAITPLLVAWALHTLRRAGFGWAQARWYQVVSIAAALALTVVEYFLEGARAAPGAGRGVLRALLCQRRTGVRPAADGLDRRSGAADRRCDGLEEAGLAVALHRGVADDDR